MISCSRLGETMTVLRPAPCVLAFYDGRSGTRVFSEAPNWVDDGALEVGLASYAIVDGPEAIVYDTHVSIPHARRIRAVLEAMGVRRMTVVLSHWHLDHIAGNAVFSDCEIIAHAACAEGMAARRQKIEAGTEEGPPALAPLVMPARTFEGELRLTVGRTPVILRHADVHSRDGAVLVLPETGLMLAGDTLEDTVTFVSEAGRLQQHLEGLAAMAGWGVHRILPNHGNPGIIAGGGYAPTLMAATQRYVTRLLACREAPELRDQDLSTFVADELKAGWITYFPAYEHVHRDNVAAVLGRGS